MTSAWEIAPLTEWQFAEHRLAPMKTPILYAILPMSALVPVTLADEAEKLEGKLVDAKGEELKLDLSKKKYFLYFYSTNAKPSPGDSFYSKQFGKLQAKHKDGAGQIIFCFYGKGKDQFEKWKEAYALTGPFPDWSKKKQAPFNNKVSGYPWLVIKDAEGQVVQAGSAHALWSQKKVMEYVK